MEVEKSVQDIFSLVEWEFSVIVFNDLVRTLGSNGKLFKIHDP